MRYILFSLCIINSIIAQNDSIHAIEEYQYTVRFLTHDSLEGRDVRNNKSNSIIEKFFFNLARKSKTKLKVHCFQFALDSTNYNSKNYYYLKNNQSKQSILIGAHYDHIGLGGKKSKSIKSNEVHNGADDNASGVSLVLNLLKMKNQLPKKYNYLFVLYGAHEEGLYGSTSFYQFLKKKKTNIHFVINYDMIGRMNQENYVKIWGVQKDTIMQKELKKTFANKFNFDIDTTLNQLDTRAFYQNAIPSISITTGMHSDYHKVSDDESKINYSGIYTIQQITLSILQSLHLPSMAANNTQR